MKVLFLDIDGVLNSTRSVLSHAGELLKTADQLKAISALKVEFDIVDDLPYGPNFTIGSIDPVAVGLINRLLLKEPRLNIVLSTTHRLHFYGPRFKNYVFGSKEHLGALKRYMTALGLQGERVIGVTSVLNTRRGLEVKDWLDRHPEVTHQCAVDDGTDFKPDDCNFVRTDAGDGLSGENFYDLTKHLGISESTIIF